MWALDRCSLNTPLILTSLTQNLLIIILYHSIIWSMSICNLIKKRCHCSCISFFFTNYRKTLYFSQIQKCSQDYFTRVFYYIFVQYNLEWTMDKWITVSYSSVDRGLFWMSKYPPPVGRIYIRNIMFIIKVQEYNNLVTIKCILLCHIFTHYNDLR